MKKRLLVILLWHNLMQTGGTHSSLVHTPEPPTMHVPSTQQSETAQLQAQLQATHQQIDALKAQIALLAAAAQTRPKPTTYYRPKGSQDPKAWRPIDKNTNWLTMQDVEIAHIMRSPQQKNRDLLQAIQELMDQIIALEKRIQAIEVFLSEEFPGTLNPIQGHTV